MLNWNIPDHFHYRLLSGQTFEMFFHIQTLLLMALTNVHTRNLQTLFVHQEVLSYHTKKTVKLGCVVRMVVDSILPLAESGPNDHRKDALPFRKLKENFRRKLKENCNLPLEYLL